MDSEHHHLGIWGSCHFQRGLTELTPSIHAKRRHAPTWRGELVSPSATSPWKADGLLTVPQLLPRLSTGAELESAFSRMTIKVLVDQRTVENQRINENHWCKNKDAVVLVPPMLTADGNSNNNHAVAPGTPSTEQTSTKKT